MWSVAMVFFSVNAACGLCLRAPFDEFAEPLRPHRRPYCSANCCCPYPSALDCGLWGTPPTGAAAPFWLLGLFAVSIGLPFFALAANNPLMQAWFAETRHPDARDPYFLYAASNIGSFLALLSYPILFEPVFTLRAQGRLWTIAFTVLDRADRRLRRTDASQSASHRRKQKLRLTPNRAGLSSAVGFSSQPCHRGSSSRSRPMSRPILPPRPCYGSSRYRSTCSRGFSCFSDGR